MHTGRMQCKDLYNVSEVNYYLNSNHKKYQAQTLRPISYVLENLLIMWRNLPTELRNV